jgi:hypothetical protein
LLVIQILCDSNLKIYNVRLLCVITIYCVVTALIPSVYLCDFYRNSLFIPFFISLFSVSLLTFDVLCEIVDFLSKFFLVCVLLSLFAFCWKLVGGNYFFSFLNPDGRTCFLYPLSFTNANWGNFIRVSGFYDEPGAFSFFICSILTLRRLLNLDNKLSYFILFLGFLTLSLAHCVFTIFFILSLEKRSKILIVFTFFCTLILYLFYISPFFDIFYNVFLIRFNISDTGIHGDNRSDGLFFLFNHLKSNFEIFLFGYDSFTLQNLYPKILNTDVEVGGNVLNLASRYGIITSSIFYITIFLLLISFKLGRSYYSVLGFSLLLFQRDYFFVVSYSFATLLVCKCIFYNLNHPSFKIKLSL